MSQLVRGDGSAALREVTFAAHDGAAFLQAKAPRWFCPRLGCRLSPRDRRGRQRSRTVACGRSHKRTGAYSDFRRPIKRRLRHRHGPAHL